MSLLCPLAADHRPSFGFKSSPKARRREPDPTRAWSLVAPSVQDTLGPYCNPRQSRPCPHPEGRVADASPQERVLSHFTHDESPAVRTRICCTSRRCAVQADGRRPDAGFLSGWLHIPDPYCPCCPWDRSTVTGPRGLGGECWKVIGGPCGPRRVNSLREVPRVRRATCLDTSGPVLLLLKAESRCPRQSVEKSPVHRQMSHTGAYFASVHLVIQYSMSIWVSVTFVLIL
jgi:hypothetical protein